MDSMSQDVVPASSINEKVELFLMEFHTAIYERNYDLMKRLYEIDFCTLSNEYYGGRRWPTDQKVQAFYQDRHFPNEVVLSLYRMLFFQHLFSRLPSEICWNDRFLSSCNYIRLLEYFANVECDPSNDTPLALPESWLWDMVSDFVYQYQQTQRWKLCFADQISKNETAMASLHAGREAWRANDVLRLLYSLIESSQVEKWLADQKSDHQKHTPLKSTSRAQPPIFLGYFSIIALMKLQVTLGNYHNALEIAKSIELFPTALYWTVPACHITLYYNLGFSYMMMRRYHDAIRVLSQILTFVIKYPDYLRARNYQQEVMIRTVDRMYLVLMLCHALSPTRLDESIMYTIRERWGAELNKLQTEGEPGFRDIFVRACPKFFSPLISEYDDPEEQAGIDQEEPLNRQISVFLKEVACQETVSKICSTAKMYNNLSLAKLAELMEMEGPDAVDIARSKMLMVKTRREELVWESGPFLSGKRVHLLSDLDINLDLDTIHVKNLTAEQNTVNEFISAIQRTQVNPWHLGTKVIPQEYLEAIKADTVARRDPLPVNGERFT